MALQISLARTTKITESFCMMRGAKILAAIAALTLLGGCAAPEETTAVAGATEAPEPRYETISGVAVAEDGDTVIIDDQSIDLWAIEAPNLDNADGWYSRAALDQFIGENGELVCILKVKRRRARDQAVCSNNRIGDLGRAMLQNGWAVVARHDKRDRDADTALAGVYDRTERRAREARVGHWKNYPSK